MKPVLLSLALFVLLLASASVFGFAYLIEPGPEGRLKYMQTAARLLLHKYSLIDELTPAEVKKLYQSTCTRKCHSRDVIERKSRTAAEWEQIVARMGFPDRANLNEIEIRTIVEYLQRNYLSNVPTILPYQTMRFLKKHMWRLDFGESDLYFDIIYLPRAHRRLMPYLAYRTMPRNTGDTLFVIYVNTHTGTVPAWDLSRITTLKVDDNPEIKALDWEVLYEDGQQHHRQGILTFPAIEGKYAGQGSLEIMIRPPGMRERIFAWRLPIPDYDPPAATVVGGAGSPETGPPRLGEGKVDLK